MTEQQYPGKNYPPTNELLNELAGKGFESLEVTISGREDLKVVGVETLQGIYSNGSVFRGFLLQVPRHRDIRMGEVLSRWRLTQRNIEKIVRETYDRCLSGRTDFSEPVSDDEDGQYWTHAHATHPKD